MPLYPVILAGGSGSRLWPLSRENMPKQFLDPLEQGSSLLQSAIECARFCTSLDPLIIANKQHRFQLHHQISALNLANSQVILEPVAKNTAASILIAALHLFSKDTGASLLILPADHYLPDLAKFKQCISVVENCTAGNVCLVAIEPTHANTQYGYIQLCDTAQNKIFDVSAFIEKPVSEVAVELFEGGRSYWNSGVVIASAALIIEQFKIFLPNLHHCVSLAFEQSEDYYGYSLLGNEFNQAQSIAFDRGILEKITNIKAVKYSGQWDDLGNWQQVLTRRESLSLNSVISQSGKLSLVLGLDDVMVIDDEDILVVASKDSIHQLTHAAQLLQKLGRTDLLSRLDVCRPWGSFKVVASGAGFLVKHLHVHPYCQISLQSHQSRIEHWVVVKGVATAQLQGQQHELMVGDSIKVDKNQRHRLINKQNSQLEIIEVQVGQILSETDIVRYDDDYERHLEG